MGVSDGASQHMERYMEKRAKLIKSQGVKDPKVYFNGGLIHFNISAIDVHCFYDTIVDVLTHNDLPFQDQDLMNIVFYDSHKILPCRYNYQVTAWMKQFDFVEEGV